MERRRGMNPPRPGLGPYIKRINDWLDAHANRNLRAMNLTRTQCHLLMALYHRDGHSASLKELESEFHVSQPTIAGLAVRMEAKQLVESHADPRDRRIKHIRLTEEGLSTCLSAHQSIVATETHLAAALTPQEQLQLKDMLRRVCDSLHEAPDSNPEI